jgi:hypothetical protein
MQPARTETNPAQLTKRCPEPVFAQRTGCNCTATLAEPLDDLQEAKATQLKPRRPRDLILQYFYYKSKMEPLSKEEYTELAELSGMSDKQVSQC